MHVCSHLLGATAHSDAYFGEGSGLIHLTFVKCFGSEYNVTECEMQNSISSSHSLDVGVKCQPGMPKHYNITYTSLQQLFLYLSQLMKLTGREIFV